MNRDEIVSIIRQELASYQSRGAYGVQSPVFHDHDGINSPPVVLNLIPVSTTWGSGGNTTTIKDSNFGTNTPFLIYVTGSTPQNGSWAYALSGGQLVITSTSPESSTLPLSYIIF